MKPTCCLCDAPSDADVRDRPLCILHLVALAENAYDRAYMAKQIASRGQASSVALKILRDFKDSGYGPLLETDR